jgi:anti-sigma28 factor (negative regulator of flagellin synthesis)
MPDTDREARILELRQLVQKGEYQIDPRAVAAAIVNEVEQTEAAPLPTSASKAAGSGD